MQQKLIGEAATWLSIVSLLFASRMETLLAEFDLTFGQFSILNHMARPDLMGGTRVSEIAGVVALKQPAVTKAMAKFEEKGFVQVEASEQDQRAKCVRLTAKGRAALQRIQHRTAPDLAQMFGTMPTDRLLSFISQMKDLGEWLDQHRGNIVA